MTSWLQKLGLGLKKSSSRLSSGISDIFTKRKIDDATLEELEELLITSDMGVKASSKIVDSLSRVRVDKSGEPEEIRTRITDVVSNILKPCEKDFAIEGSPCVILMVGVNGARQKPPQSENSLPDLEEKRFPSLPPTLSAPQPSNSFRFGESATTSASSRALPDVMPPACVLTDCKKPFAKMMTLYLLTPPAVCKTKPA